MIREFAFNLKDKNPQRNIFLEYNRQNLSRFREEHKNYDIYYSVCLYDQKDNLDNALAIAPLVFDFDSDSLQKAREDCLVIYDALLDFLDRNSIYCYFSGSKGFHLEVLHEAVGLEPKRDLMQIYRLCAENLAKKLPNNTLDLKVYEKRRLWRIANSKHPDTGLYKVFLTYDELKNLKIEEIKKKAQKPRPIPRKPVKIFKTLKDQIERFLKIYYEEKEKEIEIKHFTLSEVLLFPCIDSIIKAQIPEGERNETLLNLALFFKQKKVLKEEAKSFLKDWGQKQGLGDREIEATIDSAYSHDYHWGCANNPYCLKFCDAAHCELGFWRLPLFQAIKTYKQVLEEAKEIILAEKKEDRFLSWGLDFLDESIGKILKKDLICVVGEPGVGKTEFVFNLAKKNAEKNKKVLFLELEQENYELAIRDISQATEIDEEVLISNQHDNERKKKIIEIINSFDLEKYKDFYFWSENASSDISLIERKIEEMIKEIGLDLIVVDHLLALSDADQKRLEKEHEKIRNLVNKLKILARKYNVAVIIVLHYRRGFKKEGEIRSLDEAYGSSAIEQYAVKFLQIFREMPKNLDKIRKLQNFQKIKTYFVLQKNRRGGKQRLISAWFDQKKREYTKDFEIEEFKEENLKDFSEEKEIQSEEKFLQKINF